MQDWTPPEITPATFDAYPGGDVLDPQEGDRVRNKETGEIGVVIFVHTAWPFVGSVTVNLGDGPQLWDLGRCDVPPPVGSDG